VVLDPAVRAVMAQINKNNPGAVLLGSEIALPRQLVTTGSLSIDVALGGGFACNQWIEVIGHECLCPGTKILCADLVWRPIEDLHVGQEIIGFDEDSWGLGKGRTSCYRRAQVTHLGRKRLPVYEITTPYGKTLASAGHLWLTHGIGPRSVRDPQKAKQGVHSPQRYWCRTDKLRPGQRIASLGEPWQIETSWEAGYLAGFYDGEGCIAKQNINNSRVSCAQVLGPTAEKVTDLLEKFGFLPLLTITEPPVKYPHWQRKVVWKFPGRYQDMRFIGSIRPERLLAKADSLWEGRSTKAVHGSTVPVLAVRSLGVREVVTIETTTKTLIADGLLSHNSSGKTYVTLKMIAANQRKDPKWTVVWFATESFNERYASMLGVDLDRVIVEDENGMEAVFTHSIEFLKTKAIDCIVIDSYPGLVPARESEGDMDEFQPGLRAFLTGKFLRMASPHTKRSLTEPERPVLGVVINQWREKITAFGDPRTTPGGKGKNFFFFQRIDVQRSKWITNSREHPVGQTLKVVNVKNKLAPPGRFGEVDAYFSDCKGHKAGNYDLVKDIWTAADAYDVVQRQGSFYTFGEHRWRGQEAVRDAIRKDPALRSQIRKAVLKAATLQPVEKSAPAAKRRARAR
jgi:recombination protein RecA